MISIKDTLEDYPWECGDCLLFELCPCGEHGWCNHYGTFVEREDQNVCEEFEASMTSIRLAEQEIASAQAEEADRIYDRYKDDQMGL